MKVSLDTRKNIADAFLQHKINWSGRFNEAEFLSRLYDLKSLHSNDSRCSSAYGDIVQHRFNFIDWDNNWIFTDNRFNLLHAPHEDFLRFLCEILNPVVRPDPSDYSEHGEGTVEILKIFNSYLERDFLEIVPEERTQGRPNFKVVSKDELGQNTASKHTEIVDYLSSDYVKQQIDTMENAVNTSPYDAIGKSKELVETICKSVLKRKGLQYKPDWSLQKLVKETNKLLDFIPETISNKEESKKSIMMVLNGIATSIHGLTELRNNFGSGHGHEADFKGLEKSHAKICVGFVTEFARFYLDTLKGYYEK